MAGSVPVGRTTTGFWLTVMLCNESGRSCDMGGSDGEGTVAGGWSDGGGPSRRTVPGWRERAVVVDVLGNKNEID
jgi:hypothetical protein